jgi:chemotaxis protein methyltransferase CheR
VDELKKPDKDLTEAKRSLADVERAYIVRVLEQTQWKVSGKNSAAEILGLNRSTLRARMRKLAIRKP